MSDYVESAKKGKPVVRPIKSTTQVAAGRIKLFYKSAQEDALKGKLGKVATEFAAGMKRDQILEAASLFETLAAKLRQRTQK